MPAGSEEEQKKMKAAEERQDEYFAKQVEEATERWRKRNAEGNTHSEQWEQSQKRTSEGGATHSEPIVKDSSGATGSQATGAASSSSGGPAVVVQQPTPAAAARLPQSDMGALRRDPFRQPLLGQPGVAPNVDE